MASVDQVHELQETVGQLEATLSTTRDTVKLLQEALNARETEIQQLRKKLKGQEGLLLRRMQIISETKKERDDLRRKNAELILKQAEVGRKHSVNASPPRLRSQYSSSSVFTPPSPSPSPSHKTPSHTTSGSSIRRNSLSKQEAPPLPPLPSTPEKDKIEKDKPDEGSDTDYSDMEDDGKGKDAGKAAKNPGMRAVSPPADSPATAKRKTSQPKPIIRSGVKAASENQPSAAGLTFQVAQKNPKCKVVLGPPREALSSISEETKTGLVANGDVAQVGRERHESMDSADSSALFNSSMEMSPPVSPVKTEVAADNSLAFSRRRAISEAGFKKRTKSQEIPSEAEDVLGEMMDFEPMMRSRVSTVSTTTGRYKEIGRKNSKQLKQEAAKLSERSPNIRRSGRKLQELELISPDMELRIREKICSAIGKKYGGLRRANRAAIVIQTAYRQYKLKKRYEEIRKEAIHMRKRAQTMKDPRRRPSMVRRNRPARYRREISVLASNDPLLKTKLFSRELAKERVPHTSSRIHLVEQQRSQRAQSVEGRSERGKEGEVVENGQMEEVVEMESVVCKITLEDDGTPPMKMQLPKGDVCTDSTDSTLPTSFSADVLLTSQGYQRPLSIFSLRPSMSMDASLGSEERRIIQTITQRPLSSDVRELKMAMGIGHFNKKPTRGIQYLVRESVLPDDPQYIATFMASQYGLSKEKIGEFVGEINSEFHMAVLECLLEQMDMKDKPIDEALRVFQILFRMPGEAQKIDKIMQMFALEYFRFNKEGVIKSEDAAYILSFAIMMLHTSLHNPSVKNRTNKKQWVSMNRGCNDDDNFPEAFLLEIYDRISKREFTTGKDHTNIVSDIEKNLVGYQNTSRLAVPQRRLVCRAHVTEIDQLTSRPSFKNRRRRVLLIFNDQVIICKRRGGDQLEYRDSFTLLDAIAISFEAYHYKSGIQIYSSHNEKAIFQCNCDSSEDRVKLLKTLEDTINELKDLENERMAELGTSISKTQKEAEPERRHRIASRAGDLMSSARLNARDSVRSKRLSKGDFVSGVGDLAMSSGVANSNIIRRTSRSSGTSSPENRTSGGSHESGYDSQRTTPVPSPSPTNLSHSQPSPPPPPPPPSQRILRARPSTTSAPVTLITPVNPVTRSKSTDQINNIRVMSITPTLSREAKAKFPSAEDISRPEKNSSASNSPKTSKKKDKERKTDRPKTPKKSRMSSLSSPFRFKRSDRRGSSPGEIVASTKPQGRQRASSQTPSPPPSSDLERSTHSMGSSRAMAYMVNTT